MKKITFNSVIIALVILFAFSGCEEPRYVQDGNRHHSDEGHHRHRHGQERQPVGIDLNIHN